MSNEFYKRISSAYIQGDVGEVLTASELRGKCSMLVIRNLYFPKDRHFTEVDIIAVTKLGVFVIENKNYSGEIIGDKSSRYWKVKYSVSRIERLYNPILQNAKHKEIVQDFLSKGGFTDIPIYYPVIFNNKSTLNLRDCDKEVFTLDSFVDTYNSVDLELVESEDIIKLYNYLKPFSNQSLEMRLVHLDLLRGAR